MKRKISIFLPDLRGGGVERIRIVLAHEFVRAGHDVEFVLMQKQGELLDEVRPSFSVIDLGCLRIRTVPRALMHYLHMNKPDVLLAGMWPTTGIAIVAARLLGDSTRVCVTEHVDFRYTPSHKFGEKLILRLFGRYIYGAAHRVVAVSAGVAESLEHTTKFPQKRINVIHNPIRPYHAAPLTQADYDILKYWRMGCFRLIAIGSLKPQKDFDTLLRALASLRESRDARLLILGEGSLREDLEVLSRELGIQEYVSLPGFRANPSTFLQHSDLFVLSSRWEGFGNVIVEALAAGVPVVSTDCPSGPREILDNGKYGYLVPPGDPDQLACTIDTALEQTVSASVLKKRASDFDPSKKAEQYLRMMGLQ